jgi:predicted nucleotidyltransferase
MNLTHTQIEIYRKAALERQKSQHEQLTKRRQKALALAQRAAETLKRDFGASRVVVFGSTVNPSRFHFQSDIDLAAWDIQHYFRAVSHLMDLDPDFEFDLFPVEDANPEMLATIENEGIEL